LEEHLLNKNKNLLRTKIMYLICELRFWEKV